MGMVPREEIVYDDGVTKQSFRDSTNINKILARAARGESISHLARHGAVYGDFSDIDDLLSAQSRLARGQEIFSELPSEIRKEFNNDVGAFYRFVNDPANTDRLSTILPMLTAPGPQLPTVRRTGDNPGTEPAATPSADRQPAAPAAPEGTPPSE